MLYCHCNVGCWVYYIWYELLVILDTALAKIYFVENGLITQARLILLDSPLVFFTSATALSWTSFLNVHEQGHSQAFSQSWWFWLASTGLMLGATVSVKWVGLFTIAWVGVLTILQLWFLLGDTKNVTPVSYIYDPFFSNFNTDSDTLAYLVQTLLCARVLPNRYPSNLLYGYVCNSFYLPCEPWRWRWFHVQRVSIHSE